MPVPMPLPWLGPLFMLYPYHGSRESLLIAGSIIKLITEECACFKCSCGQCKCTSVIKCQLQPPAHQSNYRKNFGAKK